jgi:membrane protein DedA with SNARE-associated domain
VVILGGIAAGRGHHALLAIIAVAALGALTGDTVAYVIGRSAGGRLQRRWNDDPKRLARLDWAKTQIARRGGLLLITARFIPGGRTAVTLTCGITRQRWQWFVPFAALAGTLWAVYAAGLGYYFGDRFRDSHTTAFVAAFTAALSVTAVIEITRWAWGRFRGADEGDGGGNEKAAAGG